MTEETTWLAKFLNNQREIIEAAETPFAKLAIFILPILAPVVPATLTGLHIFKLLLEIFTFSSAQEISTLLSVIVSIVLEMLGYVGAISFIQSLFRWVRTREDEYLLPFGLNGAAYLFYLVAMLMINVKLGEYFGTPPIINTIVGLLSFITVPTSLLAANHLSQKEEREEEYELRQETREDRLERYRIKHGKFQETSGNLVESSRKVSTGEESFQKVSSDWRKVRPTLSKKDLERLANLSPQEMQQWSKDTNFTYKTISNWRNHARQELEQDDET